MVIVKKSRDAEISNGTEYFAYIIKKHKKCILLKCEINYALANSQSRLFAIGKCVDTPQPENLFFCFLNRISPFQLLYINLHGFNWNSCYTRVTFRTFFSNLNINGREVRIAVAFRTFFLNSPDLCNYYCGPPLKAKQRYFYSGIFLEIANFVCIVLEYMHLKFQFLSN